MGKINELMENRKRILMNTPHTAEASGGIASFRTDMKAKVREFSATIEPVQDLHGYDNPWPAGGGINQFDISKVSDGSGYTFADGVGTSSITYQGGGRVIPYTDGIAIASGTPITISADVLITQDAEDTRKIISIGAKANTASGGYTRADVEANTFDRWKRYSVTIRAPGDTNYVAIQARYSGHTVQFRNVQVEINDKNIWSGLTGYWAIADGDWTTGGSADTYQSSQKISVKEGDVFYLIPETSPSSRYVCYWNNGAFVSGSIIALSALQPITIPSGVTEFAIDLKYADNATAQAATISLFKCTASPYAPYENICPISGWESAKIIRTGRNLVNAQGGAITGSGTNEISFSFTPPKNGDYTISFNVTESSIYELSASYGKPDGSRPGAVWYNQPQMGYVNGKKSFVMTSCVAGYAYAIKIYIQSSVGTGGCTISEIQAEYGATATEYEPAVQTNLMPDIYYSGDSRVHNGITFTLNPDKSLKVSGTATGTAIYYFKESAETYEKLTSGKRYWLTGCPQGGGANTYKLDITYSGGAWNDYGDGALIEYEGQTITQIRFVIYSGVTVDFTFYPLIESEADQIVFPIAFGSTVYGGTLDVTKGKLRVTHGYVVLNGSENWYELSSGGTRIGFRNSGATNMPGRKANGQFLCNRFVDRGSSMSDLVNTWDMVWATNLNIRTDNLFADADAFKTWLVSNNLQCVYELNTPVEIDLADAPIIRTLHGENTVWADIGAIQDLEFWTHLRGE